MRIVSWNCNGALRKKLAAIDALQADVYVIQECENPEHSVKSYRNWAGDYLWIGISKNRGIGVFPKNGRNVVALDWYGSVEISAFKRANVKHSWNTNDLKLFLPFQIDSKFTVLGVWTKGSDAQIFAYMGQFWKYLQIHDADLSKLNTLIVGDFNSNAIWDKPDRWWSHTDVINELSQLGIESLYHHQSSEAQGSETAPTLYLHRKLEKPYHIDYAFMSKDLLPTSKMSIGKIDDWIPFSDHMPLTIEIG